jgi:hypothetical protein
MGTTKPFIKQPQAMPSGLFASVATPYATQPLLCLRPPSTPDRQEAPMLHLSTPGIGWSLDWPADDPCRWLTAPAINPAVFLHHYGRSYQWRLRERPLWTTEMMLECLEQLPAHSYALVELSHVLHSIPPSLFLRLLATLTGSVIPVVCCAGWREAGSRAGGHTVGWPSPGCSTWHVSVAMGVLMPTRLRKGWSRFSPASCSSGLPV